MYKGSGDNPYDFLTTNVLVLGEPGIQTGREMALAASKAPAVLLRLRERIQLRQLPAPEQLREIRQQAGLTQEELAAEVGCSRLAIVRYENGERRPKGELAERYGRVLRVLQEASA
jgi:DNA-binding XRE family transcriptional regulator